MRYQIPGNWLPAAALVLGLSAAAPGTARGESNCTCRYAGRSYGLETCVCIVTPSGPRMACCGLVLNNTSWTFTNQACPVAIAPDPVPTQQVAGRRLAAAMTK